MKNDIAFYFTIFMRRIHYFIIIFGLVAAASVSISRLLPPVYVASTSLLVESSQIPSQLAASTVQTVASEELQIIEQRLMTRINMLNVARELNVFPDIRSMSADQIVNKMQDSTSIRRSAGRGQATLMKISFEAEKGKVVADVVNRYVTIILQDNADIRANQAGKTLEFFEAEVERLDKELENQNTIILAFNNENADALPQTLNYRLSQFSTLQTRLLTTEHEISLLKDQKRRLIEIFEATGTVGLSSTSNLTPEQIRLAELKNSLLGALAIYSPTNPKIIFLEAQITHQETVVNNQAGLGGNESSSLSTVLDIQLADIDARLDLLTEQLKQNEAQLAELQDSIDRTPSVTIALESFNRDYQNIQAQYNRAVDGMSKAATGERIELLERGHRISVIDPPTVPSVPDRPNRNKIALGGSILGALLGIGLIFGLELLNSSIRRASDITKGLGITPIATVPYIRTPMELVFRRAAFTAVIALVLIGIPAALFAVHTYYLPIDLIFDRFSDKIEGFL